MSRLMPNTCKRTGHNFVPAGKPRHTPSGHYRCPDCNRIVKADVTCPCKMYGSYDSELVIRHDDGIKQAYEAAKRERSQEQGESKQRKPSQRVYVFKQRTATFTCIDCGRQFENSANGRPPKRCHECRKERQREQWRKRNAAR